MEPEINSEATPLHEAVLVRMAEVLPASRRIPFSSLVAFCSDDALAGSLTGILASSSGVSDLPIHVAPVLGYQPIPSFSSSALFVFQIVLEI